MGHFPTHASQQASNYSISSSVARQGQAKGNITVNSEPVRQALKYYTRLAQFFPPDAPAWDNASNNKWLEH
jgi:hypothetical protein